MIYNFNPPNFRKEFKTYTYNFIHQANFWFFALILDQNEFSQCLYKTKPIKDYLTIPCGQAKYIIYQSKILKKNHGIKSDVIYKQFKKHMKTWETHWKCHETNCIYEERMLRTWWEHQNPK